MDENLRKYIITKKPQLIIITQCNTFLLDELRSKTILGICDIQTLEAKGRNDGPVAQSSALYDFLLQRGNGEFEKFIQILESPEINQKEAAKILREGQSNEATQTPLWQSPHSGANFLSEPPLPSSSQLGTSTPGHHVAKNMEEEILEEYLDLVKQWKPLDVIVDPPTHGIKKKDHYNLPVKDKGLALVVNIKEFEKYDASDPDEKDLIRHGSSVDVTNLSKVLGDLGYIIWNKDRIAEKKEKWYKDVLVDLIEDFKQACEDEKPNSIIVFIGSHGERNRILTSDRPEKIRNPERKFQIQHKSLDLYKDLIYEFYHDNCPVLRGKPKIFVVSACQVEKDAVPPTLDQGVSDMIVVTAQVPGYASYRDAKTGTWLVYCLTFVLMKFSKAKSLQEMFALVSKYLEATPKKYFPDLRHGQIPEIRNTGLKELHFSLE